VAVPPLNTETDVGKDNNFVGSVAGVVIQTNKVSVDPSDAGLQGYGPRVMILKLES
jgi:hypothetical protein